MPSAIIDLADKTNPPADDPVAAPYGYRWDTKKKEWVVKRSAGGRKSGAEWFGKNILGIEKDEKPADEQMAPFEEQFDYVDPEPAHLKAKPVRRKRTPPKVTKAVKDDMTASVGLVGMLILPPLAAKDPYCGQALTDNFTQIADALVPLLCKSSTVVGFFTDTGSDFMLWFKLGMALTPVAIAVGQHHILRTVEVQQDKETGDLYVVKTDFSGFSTEEDEDDVPAGV
jgi:hypothetical protein